MAQPNGRQNVIGQSETVTKRRVRKDQSIVNKMTQGSAQVEMLKARAEGLYFYWN
jgi:hypothetical protein